MNLAVLGSCTSRDMFNKNFVPDWRNDFDIVFYQFQPSFISLCAPPIPYNRKLYYGQERTFFAEVLKAELEKTTFNDLVSVNPKYIMIDFYSDVVNGVLAVDGYSYIINREKEWKDNPLFFTIQFDEVLSPLKNKKIYMDLWKNGFDCFMEFIKTYLPNTEVIINSARATNHYEKDGVLVEHTFSIDVNKVNEVWEEMDNYASSKYGLLRLENEKDYLMNKDYLFDKNFWIVHYEKSYYLDRKNQLLRLLKRGIQEESYYKNNILLNGDCSLGTLFWKSWGESFKIVYPELFRTPLISFCQRKNKKQKWFQCWSTDIETSGLEETYILSFDCKVYDEDILSEDQVIFAIRSFEKKDLLSQKESVQDIRLKYMENTTNVDIGSDFIHYEYEFVPKGKYVSVGPFITQNGDVEWKNIQVRKKGMDSVSSPTYEKTPVEKLLLNSSDCLIDVNTISIVNLRQFM